LSLFHEFTDRENPAEFYQHVLKMALRIAKSKLKISNGRIPTLLRCIEAALKTAFF